MIAVAPVITAHTFTAWMALTESRLANSWHHTITFKSWLLWMRVNVFMNKIQMFYHLRTQASCYKQFMNCYAVYEHSSIGMAFPVLLALSARTAHRYFPLTDSPCPGGIGLLPPSGKQATENGEAWLGVSISYNPVLFYVHGSVFTHEDHCP